MGLASKLKLFWLVNLLPWPLNGVTYHPCHGHPSCQTLACYTFPFSTYGQARDRQTDGQTDRRRPSTLNAPTLWGHNAPVIQRRHLAKCSNFIDKIRNYLEARQLAVIVYSSVVLSFKFMHMEFWSSYFGFALPHCLHNLRTHSFVLRIFWWGVLICLRWQSSNKIAYQSPIIFEECLVKFTDALRHSCFTQSWSVRSWSANCISKCHYGQAVVCFISLEWIRDCCGPSAS